MQISSHLTWVAWVSHASLAGVPSNTPSQLLACICLLQFSHFLSTKLACSAPSKPFLPTPTLPPYGCGKYWLVSNPLNSVTVPCSRHSWGCHPVAWLLPPQGTNA